jgi:hypothetical protein
MMDLPDGVCLVQVSFHTDERGTLTAFDSSNLPFEPARTFLISNVPYGATRGGHRIAADEFLWAQTGKCRLTISGGAGRVSLPLDSPQQGVSVPAGFGVELSDFAPGTVLVVMSSQPYAKAEGTAL